MKRGWATERTPITAEPPCGCHACRDERETPQQRVFRVMVVCSECGNKRCPHASDHRNACTGSNEPGQPGSVY